MDHIILGLLMLKSRSIYELQARVEEGIHMMYSSSMGSIQAAIKKLLASGFICCCEQMDNGRHKKIYSITENGIQNFTTWVNEPIEISTMKNPELIKVYFMGFSHKAARAENLRKHIDALCRNLHALEIVKQESEQMSVPSEMADVASFQLATVDYGIAALKFNIQWYSQLLHKTETED